MTQPQQNLNSTSSSLFKPPGQPSQNNNLISFNSNSYPPTFTTPNQNSFTNNMNAPMQPQTQSFFQQPMQQQFQQQVFVFLQFLYLFLFSRQIITHQIKIL